nr:hypothetical protein [Acidobacteriota bacterium]
GEYGQLAERIINQLQLPYTSVNFLTESERVKDIALTHRTNLECAACLIYLLDYAMVAGDDNYRRLVSNLGYFDSWEVTNIRLLADVPEFLFDAIFRMSRADLQRLGSRLKAKVQNAAKISISGRGSHLKVGVGEWYANDGQPTDHILPCGELACIPTSMDGVVVVEGTMLGTIPFGFKYGRIHAGDLILEFSDRHVVGVSGDNRDLVADVETIFASLPALRRVGEAAISFNTAIEHLPGIGYQWEEKYPGFHFGLGAELSENLTTLSERECDHHIDIILDRVDIHADAIPVFIDGQLRL